LSELDQNSFNLYKQRKEGLCSAGDGADLQSALAEWTGQKTVPNVFVKGERIGGCDATMAMHDGGKLVPLLTEAGAIVTASATATTTPSL